MSVKERQRLELLARVRDKQVTLAKVAEVLALSYRHLKRLWKRYRQHGDAGLVHRLRGRPSARRIAEPKRQAILQRYERQYRGFGPTLATEHLAAEGLRLDHETLRRWLIGAGLWQRQRKRARHRQWRARKEHAGELVQMDGSHHDWFEGRRGPAVLMVMIDDATNRTYARFFEAETTEAAMETFQRYARRYGLPQALYVDLDSIYRVAPGATLTVEEQLANQTRLTQFGRAMKTLGVRIVPAYSPQAKGRVERRNGVLQDRLVKEMRLAGCHDLVSANAFLETTFLSDLNRRFCVPAAQAANLHRPVPPGLKLAEVLSVEELRVVTRDWTVAWQGRWFQLTRQNPVLPAPGRRIVVRQLRDGNVQLLYQGQKLRWRELPERPKPRPTRKPLRIGPRRSCVPTADHPWRRFGIALGWKSRHAAALVSSDGLRPAAPIRSRLPPTAFRSRKARLRTPVSKRELVRSARHKPPARSCEGETRST
jgi:hypothetical protein